MIVGGRVNNVSDLTQSIIGRGNGYTILQYGGVVRTLVRLLRNKQLFFGLELGYGLRRWLRGFQRPSPLPRGTDHPPERRDALQLPIRPGLPRGPLALSPPPRDSVERHYFKGTFGYDITESFIARADIIYSLANRPVAYPGNAVNLGVELDAQLMYRNEKEGFYFGLAYGVLFPFRALSLPAEIFGSTFAQNPSTAQTVQARVVVKF